MPDREPNHRNERRDPTSRRGAKAEARARAAQILAQEQRRARRRAALWQASVGLAVLVIIGGTVAYLVSREEPATTPAQVNADDALVVGAADAKVQITLIEDFQCPVCKAFEEQASDVLNAYVEGGDVSVAYRGIAFLDNQSSTNYSTRALNASGCVMGQGQTVWKKFHEELFTQQPPEGGAGLTDPQLIGIAADAGADRATVDDCIEDAQYEGWVSRATETAFDDGITGTPTLIVDGEVIDLRFDQSIADQVSAAVDRALAP